MAEETRMLFVTGVFSGDVYTHVEAGRDTEEWKAELTKMLNESHQKNGYVGILSLAKFEDTGDYEIVSSAMSVDRKIWNAFDEAEAETIRQIFKKPYDITVADLGVSPTAAPFHIFQASTPNRNVEGTDIICTACGACEAIGSLILHLKRKAPDHPLTIGKIILPEPSIFQTELDNGHVTLESQTEEKLRGNFQFELTSGKRLVDMKLGEIEHTTIPTNYPGGIFIRRVK